MKALPPVSTRGPDTEADLRAILNPRAVAIVGATDDQSKFGGRALRYLQRHEFAGNIFPVNPRRAELLGFRCYPNIRDVKLPIDVALLTVPASHLITAVEDCGAAGVRGCIVVTSDFAETGEEGVRRQAELVAVARKAGVRLIGPNCLGFVNPGHKLALSSSVTLAVDYLPRGGIGLVCQSGSVMASMISHAFDDGAGFSVCATVGNQADINACDFIDYFAGDPATKVICAYLEGISDGAKFVDAAKRCREAGKPLLVVKAGRTEAGASITQSHTASLAGSYEVFEAVCRQHSVILMDDPDNMLKAAEFLSAYGAPAGDGIAAMTPSGGTAAITGDRISAAKLRLAQLGPQSVGALHEIFSASRHVNPLDVGGMPGEVMMEAAVRPLEIFGRDSDVGMVLVVIATSPALDRKAAAWSEVAMECGKPVIFVLTPGSILDPVRKVLRDLGRPYCNSLDQAIAVLRACASAAVPAGGEEARRPAYAGDPARIVQGIAERQLLEPEAKSLLAAVQIPVTREAVAKDADTAVKLAQGFGGPVVLKAVSRDIIHKSDVGGVKVGLRTDADIRSAFRSILANVAANAPNACLDGLLVQEMAKPGIEMIIGARHDPQFGPVVLVGMGGIYVELLSDVQMAPAPVSRRQARALVEGLKAWPLLDGGRGRPKADVEALAEAIERLSWLAADLAGQLNDIEVNPIFVGNAGAGVVAVDARASLCTKEKQES